MSPRMPGPPQPTPPAGMVLVTVEQLRDATACPDCDSALYFYPVPIPLPGNGVTLFGVYIAHDDTCPAMQAAAAQQQGGNQP